jgi:hypothetical protein
MRADFIMLRRNDLGGIDSSVIMMTPHRRVVSTRRDAEGRCSAWR